MDYQSGSKQPHSKGCRVISPLHVFSAPVKNPVEEEFERAVRLRAEIDFRPEHKQLALADVRLDHRHAVLQVFLPPGPAATQRSVAREPCDRIDSFQGRLGLQPEHRAVVEEHVDLLRHPVSQRVRVVDAHLQERAGDVQFIAVKTVPPASMKAFSCGTVFATVTPPNLPRNSSGISSALGIRENGASSAPGAAAPPRPPPARPSPARPSPARPSRAGMAPVTKTITSNLLIRSPASSVCGYTTVNGNSNCSNNQRVHPDGIEPP